MDNIKKFFDSEEDYQTFLTAEKELEERMKLNIISFDIISFDEEDECKE